ncbi:hypothetical protein P170DRAFT_508432 [Aspergillus steynii IBT 23096]|uniref:Uncharacterized protein n=1 Tax=Aspergillus steynii IBT 23096 TaxID=1392250 RepID=A0A2I2GBJ7_9EURO|nr:uncharacterized protein P170DRAFT_508432 [Aspergillus steynii IBT 23096]PLB50217.1 hypothetical protein P170DRAFT_508432 [Aspergillus steynii IBT 23096]
MAQNESTKKSALEVEPGPPACDVAAERSPAKDGETSPDDINVSTELNHDMSYAASVNASESEQQLALYFPLDFLQPYGVYRVETTYGKVMFSPTDAMKNLMNRILHADRTAKSQPQERLDQYKKTAQKIGWHMDESDGMDSVKPQLFAIFCAFEESPDTFNKQIVDIDDLTLSPRHMLHVASNEPFNLCPDAVMINMEPNLISRSSKFATATSYRYSLCPLEEYSRKKSILVHAITYKRFPEVPQKPFRQCLSYIGASLRISAELAEEAGIDLKEDPIPACVAIEYRAFMWHFTVVALVEDPSHGKIILFEEVPGVNMSPRRPAELCSLIEIFKAIALHFNEVWWEWIERLMARLEHKHSAEEPA